jgi:hypothetical protein
MELTTAAIHHLNCFVSPELQAAPIQIRVKAWQACLECLNRYSLQLLSKQSSQHS